MRRLFAIKTLCLLLGAITLSSNALAQTAPSSGAFTFSPVVRRGDPTAEAGAFFDCDVCDTQIAGPHGLNDSGQVVLFGFGDNCEGVFVVSNRTGFRILDFCRPTPFGTLALFAGANINNQGQVALNVGPNIHNTIIDMILLYSDGQLTKIAADGDLSPDGKTFGNCGFSLPSINDNGDVAFSSCFQDSTGTFAGDGIFASSNGQLRKIAADADPSPVGGQFAFALVPPPNTSINNSGDVLFAAGQIDSFTLPERFGLFLATSDGLKKVELSRDPLPDGSQAADDSLGGGLLNNKGDVVFGLRLAGKPQVGYFLYSGGQTSTIILDHQATPIGGTYNLTKDVEDPFGPKINDNGTVALMANVKGGSSPEAVFLASPRAVLKVIAVGDRLPTGEKIRSINSFSLNNLGQVAFFANGSASIVNTLPLGVFLATPNAPAISSVKLKQKKGALQLIVNGSAMIDNDSVIEVNGVPLNEMSYPAEAREQGGTVKQVVSRDPRLDQLIPAGQSVQVTVFNPLTNLRSTAIRFVR